MDRYVDFYDIISIFLSAMKARAETLEGQGIGSVLSGRQVHFHNGPHETSKHCLIQRHAMREPPPT